jgi:hypothetical protein
MEPNLVVHLKDGAVIETFAQLWYLHSEMMRAKTSFDLRVPAAASAPAVLQLPDHSVHAATHFDKWCRREDKYHPMGGAERYFECIQLGEYLIADAFVQYVHERALYAGIDWKQCIEPMSRSATPHTIRDLASRMLDTADFVFGTRSGVCPLLTHVVLDNLLEICDLRLRCNIFRRRRYYNEDNLSSDSDSDSERMHCVDIAGRRNLVGVSRLIYQVFLRFVPLHTKKPVGLWLRRAEVRRKLMHLLQLCEPHCVHVRRFLRTYKKWRKLIL